MNAVNLTTKMLCLSNYFKIKGITKCIVEYQIQKNISK